jgi:hypothetical protein
MPPIRWIQMRGGCRDDGALFPPFWYGAGLAHLVANLGHQAGAAGWRLGAHEELAAMCWPCPSTTAASANVARFPGMAMPAIALVAIGLRDRPKCVTPALDRAEGGGWVGPCSGARDRDAPRWLVDAHSDGPARCSRTPPRRGGLPRHRMPKLNGYDSLPKDSRAIVWAQYSSDRQTGWGQAHDRRRSEEAGFDGHLVKPLDLTALDALLQS